MEEVWKNSVPRAQNQQKYTIGRLINNEGTNLYSLNTASTRSSSVFELLMLIIYCEDQIIYDIYQILKFITQEEPENQSSNEYIFHIYYQIYFLPVRNMSLWAEQIEIKKFTNLFVHWLDELRVHEWINNFN